MIANLVALWHASVHISNLFSSLLLLFVVLYWVVVLCGVADVSTDRERALVYVGMSRARSQLVMVVSESVRKLMPELTRRRLAENWGG